MYCHDNFTALEEAIKKFPDLCEGNPIKAWKHFLSCSTTNDIFSQFKEIGKNIARELVTLYCLAHPSNKKARKKIENILRRTKNSNNHDEIQHQVSMELDEHIFSSRTKSKWHSTILLNNVLLNYINPTNKKVFPLLAPLTYAQIYFFSKMKEKIDQKEIQNNLKNELKVIQYLPAKSSPYTQRSNEHQEEEVQTLL